MKKRTAKMVMDSTIFSRHMENGKPQWSFLSVFPDRLVGHSVRRLSRRFTKPISAFVVNK